MNRKVNKPKASLKLPAWIPPSDLEEAREQVLSLGRDINEHAYILGKLLIWVKTKLPHGQFTPWIKKHVWLSERTAQKYMGFSRRCDEENRLLEYHEPNPKSNSKHAETADLKKGKPHLRVVDGSSNNIPATSDRELSGILDDLFSKEISQEELWERLLKVLNIIVDKFEDVLVLPTTLNRETFLGVHCLVSWIESQSRNITNEFRHHVFSYEFDPTKGKLGRYVLSSKKPRRRKVAQDPNQYGLNLG